jgi:hypothetical protein
MAVNVYELLSKLIAHEQSERSIGNQTAAETFAEKIQQLLTKHKLTMDDISIQEESAAPINSDFAEAKNDMWRGFLSVGVANMTYTYAQWGRNKVLIKFTGKKDDVVAALKMFAFLQETAVRICDMAWGEVYWERKRAGISISAGDSRSWRNSWFIGFSRGIQDRVESLRKRLESESYNKNALVLINDIEQQIADFLGKPKLKYNNQRFSINEKAYAGGYETGQKTSFSGERILT